jgi:3-dehydroquinate synthase
MFMIKQTIVLTGFMGSGKTTVGRMFAARTGRVFVDTDELIALRAGRSIADIFATDGEPAFRQMERDTAAELSGREHLVLATGGGLLLDPDNVAALAKNGRIFCLTADPAEIMRRVGQTGVERPLLAGPDPAGQVQRILAQRQATYARFTQIETDERPPDAVVAAILAALHEESPLAAPIGPEPLTVTHPAGAYSVWVGAGFLRRWREIAGVAGPVVVVTDENVGSLFARRLGEMAALITLPAGEQHKTLATVQSIYDQLLTAGIDRTGAILALGGGVVGDTAGFAAATFMRGIPVVQCPTSLLAMVDASVGGKTGVDLPQGKNLVGAFKQPQAVLADLTTLRTLPPAEFAAGLAEVVKHGLLAAPHILTRLENEDWAGHEATAPGRVDSLWNLVCEAIKVKRDFVQVDPFEGGRRALLNLGHTFAHAIEQVSGYQVGHGQAVAMGLVAAARLSAHLGHASPGLQTRIEKILGCCYLPARIPAAYAAEDIYAAMFTDKKKTSGRLRFILIRDIGDCFIASDVPAEMVIKAIQHLQE